MKVQGYMLIDWNSPFKPNWQWVSLPQRVYSSFDQALQASEGFKRVVPVEAKVSHRDGYARYFRFIPTSNEPSFMRDSNPAKRRFRFIS